MKFDIENILYIIVLIVWAIVGVIKKRNAAKGRPTTAMPPLGENPGGKEFNDALEEIFGKKSSIEAVAQKTIEKRPPSLKKFASLETIADSDAGQRSLKIQKGKKRSSEILKNSPLQATDAKKNPETSSAEEPVKESLTVDLREAVISSVILTPYQ